ncbi:AEC family transporter [Actinoplanes sp. GCM10030250]|uniref:AEC family transporter n=1 Tax=Actinoplanes sp. GCM10030250 TaxID=3273376 RepID=UPI003622DE7D
MISALSGFVLIGAIVATGWALRRWAGLPERTGPLVGRVVYLVLTPCLLFTGVAAADPAVLFTRPLLVSTAAAVTCFTIFALAFRKREASARILGALAGGYTNANYIGLPIATYVLGDATLVVPIVMLQLLIITPLAMLLLEFATTGRATWRSVLRRPARNPLIIAVLLGAAVALTGLRLPAVVLDPITTLGQAAVPMVLLAFGMSLSGRWLLAPGPDRTPTIVAVTLKAAGMPVIAFGMALAAGLSRDATYAVTVLAALPTAQNIFLYAQQFRTGIVLVRDAVFLSTVACVPVMMVIAALFAL